jgi:hypothetical protein
VKKQSGSQTLEFYVTTQDLRAVFDTFFAIILCSAVALTMVYLTAELALLMLHMPV